MRIDGLVLARPGGIWVKAPAVAALLMATVIATSSIVFSEPSVGDALMAGAVFGLPLLRVMRLGGVTLLNLALWLAIVAAGIGATTLSVTFDTAIKHQLITLFLVMSAVTVAGYVAADPESRFKLVMDAYVFACLVATAAALAGYFNLLPRAYDLFTEYGRARGTFKDPNVYGAAVAPAVGYLVWTMLRSKPRRALLAAAIAAPLMLGLLVSFSRGAWISTGITIALVVWIGAARTRRKADHLRLAKFAAIGTIGLAAVVFAALQVDKVEALMSERASLSQSYDVGPEGRFGGQRKAVELILDNPLGIGTHTFRDRYHPEEAHNVYLSTFLNAGWIGGLLFIISVGMTVAVGLAHALRLGALQGAFVVAAAAFAGVAFEGIIIDTDHWRHLFILMGLVWGLADAAPRHIPGDGRRDD